MNHAPITFIAREKEYAFMVHAKALIIVLVMKCVGFRRLKWKEGDTVSMIGSARGSESAM